MKRPVEDYDAIIVGSGFGGAAAAHTLTRAGWKTLLLERGGWTKRDERDWNPREILLRQRYRSRSPLRVKQYGARRFSEVYANEVVGGQSVFYGGASLRLRERDFERWPLSYGDLERYYGEAERLLGVHGESGQDVHEPPRSQEYPFAALELTEPARRLHEAAGKLGFRPFKIPLAINFTDASRPLCIRCVTCDGFPCKIEAKNDLAVALLQEAQEQGLEIVTGAFVQRLVEEGGMIRSVECIDTDSLRDFKLSARVVILGAGALQSPAILLRSGLERFEQHRLIGRFLMRHCNAVAGCVFPFRTNPGEIFHKQLCFGEFYEEMRERYGTAVGVIQDIYTPVPEVIRHFAPRGVKRVAGLASRYMQNLLCVAEDDPQHENRVRLAKEKDRYGAELVEVEHRYSREDYARRAYLVGKAKKVLHKAGGLIPFVYDIDTFSHAVGTLRFGLSAEESVLDRNCRFWGIDNLFVLDGSFMPTSGGVNPSLTIAANALRVAEFIAGRLKNSGEIDARFT